MATQSPDPQQGLPGHKTVSFYGNDVTIANPYLCYEIMYM